MCLLLLRFRAYLFDMVGSFFVGTIWNVHSLFAQKFHVALAVNNQSIYVDYTNTATRRSVKVKYTDLLKYLVESILFKYS